MTDTASAQDVALATRILSEFGGDMAEWTEHLHPEIVVEFPMGASVKAPLRIEGKEAAARMFHAVNDNVQVRFREIQVIPTATPGKVVAEYKGLSHPGGATYDQVYITVMVLSDGKLSGFREYWDTAVIERVFGDLSSLA